MKISNFIPLVLVVSLVACSSPKPSKVTKTSAPKDSTVYVITKTKKISVPINKDLKVSEGKLVAIFHQENYKKVGDHTFANPYESYTVTISLSDASVHGEPKLHFKYSGNKSIKERSVSLNKKSFLNCGEKCFLVMTKESVEYFHYKILSNKNTALKYVNTKDYFVEYKGFF